jgi:hypothetical protein
VSGLRLYNIGAVIELQLSNAELIVRGDWDPINHSMALMEEAILRHENSDLSPDEWAGL